jgi:NAD dependent epimerase/dehydratase family enzyme
VLDPSGGCLGGLLPICRVLGGVQLGNPRAALSWIARDDVVRLISFALANDRWFGPLNVTGPNPAAQSEFAAEIALALRRRVALHAPSWLLRAALGEFSRALLDDQRVLPAKAISAGFPFANPNLRDCLAALLRPSV